VAQFVVCVGAADAATVTFKANVGWVGKFQGSSHWTR
jgi:hypothetical protein